ncbi:hypothetical protein VHEMI00552 [[Torrubiella] hemipterigena]|uniref:Uncharacterized protein n=1 Tax=[Torrubiella] hemipterigena TaxID=1531966 RepID=A0A0A1T288_9HYPO|nr:hypothetical protein VHEMI00552 [[Torrubiella] hemipterigena]
MEALQHLALNLPEWQGRLEQLQKQSQQISPCSTTISSTSPLLSESTTIISEQDETLNKTLTETALPDVHYDGDVQALFSELVRYVSTSRGLMRRAKMASKVAQIKRLAEFDLDTEDEQVLPTHTPASHRIRVKTNRTASSKDSASEIFDTLERHLDLVNSLSEDAAHQFLRKSDCREEVEQILSRISVLIHASNTEIRRLKRLTTQETTDTAKVRTRRSISIRREVRELKGQTAPVKPCDIIPFMDDGMMCLEVDPDVCPGVTTTTNLVMPKAQ